MKNKETNILDVLEAFKHLKLELKRQSTKIRILEQRYLYGKPPIFMSEANKREIKRINKIIKAEAEAK